MTAPAFPWGQNYLGMRISSVHQPAKNDDLRSAVFFTGDFTGDCVVRADTRSPEICSGQGEGENWGDARESLGPSLFLPVR